MRLSGEKDRVLAILQAALDLVDIEEEWRPTKFGHLALCHCAALANANRFRVEQSALDFSVATSFEQR
jgi:hypothetical protein